MINEGMTVHGRRFIPVNITPLFSMGKRGWFIILLLIPLVWPHGYVKKPASRAYLCQRGINHRCGRVKYEPQSIEAPKGFPKRGPADHHIAGGGQFIGLDAVGRHRWVKIKLNNKLLPLNNSHYLLPIEWIYTAPHRTSGYHLFGTKRGYDGSQPLSRHYLAFIDSVNTTGTPYRHYNHTVLKKRVHAVGVLLLIWEIADTGNAFYQVIDYTYRRRLVGRRSYGDYIDSM